MAMKSTGFFILVCCGVCLGPAALAVAAEAQAEGAAVSDASLSVVAVLRHEDALNEAHDVELDGEFAYVAGKGGSIAIIGVADPSRPELVWFRRDSEVLSDSETVLLAPGRLFLGTDDFHSIDVTNPRAPKFDATLSDRTKIHTINGMIRRGDHVFAASKRGLVTAFDVSDPSSPKLAGVLETRERFQIVCPHDIDFLGPYLVVADPNGFGLHPGNLALFRVFDDAGRLLPDSEWRLAGRLSDDALKGANRVQVHGSHAFVGGSCFPQVSQGKPMAKGAVVDLAEPAAPKLVATVAFPDPRGPNGLTIAGHVWFLAGGQTVEAYDVRDPLQPRLLASFASAEAFPTADDNAHDLVYRDGYLYVTSQGDHGLVVLRVEGEEIRRLASAHPSFDGAKNDRGVWHRNTFPGPGHVENAGPWGPCQGSDRTEFINYFKVSPVDPTFMAPGTDYRHEFITDGAEAKPAGSFPIAKSSNASFHPFDGNRLFPHCGPHEWWEKPTGWTQLFKDRIQRANHRVKRLVERKRGHQARDLLDYRPRLTSFCGILLACGSGMVVAEPCSSRMGHTFVTPDTSGPENPAESADRCFVSFSRKMGIDPLL
jgi:hypothetical protein